MHEQKIIDDIMSRLNVGNYKTHLISLVCSEQLELSISVDINKCKEIKPSLTANNREAA